MFLLYEASKKCSCVSCGAKKTYLYESKVKLNRFNKKAHRKEEMLTIFSTTLFKYISLFRHYIESVNVLI